MLVMTDSLQAFIDEQVNATSDETAFFINKKVRDFIQQDPSGEQASKILAPWYESKEKPTKIDDVVTVKFASLVLKALTVTRYIKESKPLSFPALIEQYQIGTEWQKQVSASAITNRVKKVANEEEFATWFKEMTSLKTGEDIPYLRQTAQRFEGLS